MIDGAAADNHLAAQNNWGRGLDAIEKAIRNALDKGDAENPAFREKVYKSAFAALDRAMLATPNATVEAAIARRKHLQRRIREIESEYQPALAAAPQPPPVRTQQAAAPASSAAPKVGVPRSEPDGMHAPAVELGRRRPAAPAEAPSVDAPRPAAPVEAPSVDAPRHAAAPSGAPELSLDDVRPDAFAATGGAGRGPSQAEFDRDFAPSDRVPYRVPAGPDATVAPDRDPRRAARRRSWPAIFVAATIVATVAVGGWWAVQTGLFLSPAERDASVPNPPDTAEEEDFDPGTADAPPASGQPAPDRRWISIFTPDDPGLVNAAAGTSAEVAEDDTGRFMRIRSGTPGSGVTFDVGQGILERIAGRTVVFDVVARAENDQGTEMSVDCDLGALGECGRKRYAVGYERGEYLFEAEFAAASPGSGGTLTINSDFAGQGRAVDIYEIRVSLAP